ncbi:MAG TPA: phosphoribosylanthranilate isomerase [Solirubrobacteraceae bacterium]|nr:phosphoribosylanthranilate isomerase [Solirubrobacteraceae bacterium]
MKAPKIKFCGITREQDAELAVSLDAWAVGLNMWPGSSRAVPLDRAAGLAAMLKRRAEIVGVFVNATLDEVTATADAVGLTILQLHGQEGPQFCNEAARRTGCKVIKAARVHSGADIQALAAYHTDFHLLDSFKPGVPGGTGETFNWALAAEHRRIAPPKGRGQRVPLILSGGLTPDNVAAAIGIVRPFAVDVASGIESAPGHKDAELMRAFAEAVAGTAEIGPSSSSEENDNESHSHLGPGDEAHAA